MHITPINTAEAILDPFWDPHLDPLKKWKIAPGKGHGLHVRQNWCWVEFDWARSPAKGPALRMSRKYNLDVAGYDRLMVSAQLPAKSLLQIIAHTDKGTISLEAAPHPDDQKEYVVDLEAATRLHGITLEVYAREEGVATGWFNWVGLQNSQQLARHLAQWARFDKRWEQHLQPERFDPKFEPAYGILVNADELKALRKTHDAFLKQHGTSPFVAAAKAAKTLVPEEGIHDFAGSANRYGRDRDPHVLLGHGVNAAAAGILLKDKKLLRLAARYALSLAMCEHWEDGMICTFPGGVFEHRCFMSGNCVHELALILDLAGEYFTDTGREFILRRIAQEGLGSINFNAWKYEYIYRCNQLALFSRGRIAGYAVLDRNFPHHVKPYMELARRELIESLGYNILPDGGNTEGSIYCLACLGLAGTALYYYARAKGVAFQSVVPDILRRTGRYAAAILSTDEDGVCEYIPLSDTRGLGPAHDQAPLAVLAAMVPDSAWVTMYRRSLRRTGGMPNSILACLLEGDIPRKGPEPEPFVSLPDLGMMASVRRLGNETVKLLVMGNKAGGGHSHEDKGSFVLEFAAETFAVDPGTCEYTNPLSQVMLNCQRHNMLVPVLPGERPHPQNPLMTDVTPRGKGDRATFRAEMDLAPGWDGNYKKWVRQWDSPAPDTLIIRDTYELVKGSAVEFYWQTQRQVTINGNKIELSGKRGRVVIEAPTDCNIRVDDLPLHNAKGLPLPTRDFQRRITIRKEANSGCLEIRATLIPLTGLA